MNKNQIRHWIDEFFGDDNKHFIIKISILDNRKVIIVVDGENGVSIKTCLQLNKYLKDKLKDMNIGIEVTSPGLESDIINTRQYNKLIGKMIRIKTQEKTYEGLLTSWNNDQISIRWEERDNRQVGKGKTTVLRMANIAIKEIVQSNALIKNKF